MSNHVVNALFDDGRWTVTPYLFQYDYGQILTFSGIELPASYEVQFSNVQTGGETVTRLGSQAGVIIPNSLLTSGEYVYVWIFLHDDVNDGETEYNLVIPVIARPEPVYEEPTPEQESLIIEAIVALNKGVADAEEAAEAAAGSAGEAAESAGDASGYATLAESWAHGGTGTREGEDMDNSMFYAEQAAQAAAYAGWVHFYIDRYGDLHYVKTPNTLLTFSLVNGDLHVQLGG